MKKDILSMLPEEIEAELENLGEPKYRAQQLFTWLHRGVRDFELMSNLSKPLRQKLQENYRLYRPRVLKKQVSQIDGTIKYLWELSDGNAVETVVMQYKHGNTVCVSSQVGCRELPISNIVLMGIGEPLDNFDNVMRFLELVNHPKGMNIGMRHISLSTCGLIERFDDLADRDLQLTLSVSLHAPDDETRSRIMPANRGRGVEKLMEACRRYYERTGRRISFEYAMIDGVNDTEYHAKLLAKEARSLAAHVNLIPLNHVEERQFKPSTSCHMKAFIKILEDAGVNVTVRRRLGSDVDASCGQLRRKMQAKGTLETEVSAVK